MSSISNDLEIDNLPNRLTIFRVLMIPLVVGLLVCSQEPYFEFNDSTRSWMGWIAAWIFVAASITDFLDGYIARKRNIQTVFGTFLDPIADKFLVVSALIVLGWMTRVHVVVVIVLVLREFYMTSLRLLAMNEGLTVPVSDSGKWKTGMQMTGIPMLMANETLIFLPLNPIGTLCIWIACILSLMSAVNYSLSVIMKIREKRKLKLSK